MSTFRDNLQTQTSAAGLQVVKQLGDMLTYASRGGTAYTLYADPGLNENRTLENELGLSTEDTARRFWIPAQTNFPPSGGPAMGDQIVYKTFTWEVRDYQADGVGGSSDTAVGYFINAVRVHVSRAGANE